MRLAVALIALAVLTHPAAAAEKTAKAAKVTKAAAKARVIEMSVTSDGFVPDTVKVKKGEPLRLVITRKTDKTCATEIVIKDYGINTPLPLGKTVSVTLTPREVGAIKYACAMDMITGQLVVE